MNLLKPLTPSLLALALAACALVARRTVHQPVVQALAHV